MGQEAPCIVCRHCLLSIRTPVRIIARRAFPSQADRCVTIIQFNERDADHVSRSHLIPFSTPFDRTSNSVAEMQRARMKKAYHSSSPGVSANGSVSCRSSGSAKSPGRAGASRTAVALLRTATHPLAISICPGCSRHLAQKFLDRALLHVPRGSMRWPVAHLRNRDRHPHHNRYPFPSRAPDRTGLHRHHLARRPHHIHNPHLMRRSSREHSSPNSTTSSWANRSAYSALWNGIVWRAGR